MAKKKAPTAKAEPAEARAVIVHLKGTQAYAEWLEQAHAKTHFPKATIMRLALADWAKKNGISPPPEI